MAAAASSKVAPAAGRAKFISTTLAATILRSDRFMVHPLRLLCIMQPFGYSRKISLDAI
jgi:hypothetical protein